MIVVVVLSWGQGLVFRDVVAIATIAHDAQAENDFGGWLELLSTGMLEPHDSNPVVKMMMHLSTIKCEDCQHARV